LGYIRDPTPPTTPERVRNVAQRNERDQRVLDSPEHHRTPHHVRIARLGVSVPPIPPPVFMPPPIAPPPAPLYSHLPAHLAEQYAALPPLNPRRQALVAPVPAPQLAPAFIPAPAPAPAPVMRYQHLPADLAQRVAALPPLIQPGRGRGRGRGRVNNPTMPFAEIAAQHAALQPVCFILLLYYQIYFINNSQLRSFHHLDLYLNPLHLQLLLCHLRNLLLNMLLFLHYNLHHR
jgi:hypothetical protein